MATGEVESAASHPALALLGHLARIGRRAAEAATAPGGLRPRHLIALTLLGEHGPASQQGLAEALGLDPSNVVALLNDLEDRGLVTRRRDPVDRRRHIVELSADGDAELTSAQQRLACVEDQVFQALTPDERETLHRLLVRAAAGQFASCAEAAEVADDPDCPA